MQKILLTCFLALPCLFGSSMELRKVAQSPPEPSIHRSAVPVSPHSGDTHRGGVARPDTLAKITHGKEFSELPIYSSSLSTLDGGPTLRSSDIRHRTALLSPISGLPPSTNETASLRASTRSGASQHRTSDTQHRTSLRSAVSRLPSLTNFGLINPDQDMGAGEGIADSQLAPFPVLPNGQFNSDREAHSQSTEAQSLAFKKSDLFPFLALIDQTASSHLGASRSDDLLHRSPVSGLPANQPIPPNQKGEIHLEIASPIPPDTLWITFWEHLLSDAPSVTPGTRIPLIAEKGTYFEGSAGTQVFSFKFPEEQESGFITIATGKSILADQWSIHAGDRVRIRFDLTNGFTLFGGPKAAFYKTQYLLDQVFKEEKFNSNPILIANRSEGLFGDDASGAAYRKAKSKAQDIHVSMQVLVPKENGWDYLQDYLNKPLDLHPAFTILENASPDLMDWEREKLNSRVKGQILSTATKRAERIADQLVADQEKGEALLNWSKALRLDQVKNSHPLLVQGVTRLEILQSKIHADSLLANLTQYPDPIKDELLGYFLLSNYNRLQENLDAYLLTGIEQVSTPWIKSRLEYLHQVQLGPFLSEGLYDIEGRKVDLSQFEGKTLLLHFWISGCKFCKDDYEMALQPLQELLESNEDILLVTVNADGEEGSWKTSLATGNYTSPEMLNLRAEKGIGVLDRYKIHSFPQKMIIGPDSKIRLQTLDKMGPIQLQLLLNRTQSNSELTISSTQPH